MHFANTFCLYACVGFPRHRIGHGATLSCAWHAHVHAPRHALTGTRRISVMRGMRKHCRTMAGTQEKYTPRIHREKQQTHNKNVCVCGFCVRCSVGVNVHYTIREHLDVRNGIAWRQGFLFDWRQTKVKIYDDAEVGVCVSC